MTINYDYCNYSYHTNRIAIIMKSIGIDMTVLQLFSTNHKRNINNFNLEKFKLMWHIQVMRFDKSKFENFLKLVLDMHCFKYVDDNIYEAYYDKVNHKYENEQCIMIAKCDSSDGATFSKLASDYSKNRGILELCQTQIGVESQIDNKVENESFTCKNSKIQKIYFLTDNIVNGSSTERMLRHHFKEHLSQTEVSENNKRKFIKLNRGKTLKEIYDTNACEIVLLPIFCSESSCDNINERISRNGNYLKNKVTIECSEILDNKFKVKEETKKVVEDLYDHNLQEMNFMCYFRKISMPNYTVFPKEIVKTKYVVGLFERRDEHC